MDAAAEYLYFSAMQQIEYHSTPVYSRLVAGHNRYDPGYRVLRTTGTNDYVLQLTLSGCGYFTEEKKRIVLPEKSVVLIPPGTPHDYGTHLDYPYWDVVWIHFHPWEHWEPLLENALSEASGISLIHMDDSTLAKQTRDAFLEALRISVSGAAQKDIWAMNALERGLLHCDKFKPFGAHAHRDERLDKSIDFMLQRMGESLTVANIAQAAGLSPSYFAHLFRATLKMPPLRYLEHQRLDRARDLLARTHQPVSQIAEELGFKDPFYFSRRFQKLNGLSPRAFRKRMTD